MGSSQTVSAPQLLLSTNTKINIKLNKLRNNTYLLARILFLEQIIIDIIVFLNQNLFVFSLKCQYMQVDSAQNEVPSEFCATVGKADE